MSQELEIARKAALAAADLVRDYHTEHSGLGIRYKGRHDLVTKADVTSEEVILSYIKDAFPNDEILAEESTGEEALTDRRTWIVDPIDGTTNFAHQFPLFCVSIALYENKKAQIGLVYEVNQGELFTAERGEGAKLNGKRINVSDIDQPDEALFGTGFPYRDLELIDDYLQLFKVFMEETQGVRRPGTAAFDLCCVAAGRFDGFYEYSLAPWDVAAASLIIQEAGGVVTDWEDDQKWLFGKRIVAANPTMHKYILKRIKDTIPVKYRKAK